MDDKKIAQQHVYYTFNATENTAVINNGSVLVNAFVPFMTKRLKINFAYVFTGNGLVNYIITSDVTNNDIVGSLAKLSTVRGGGANAYVSSDNFRADTTFEYIFKEPKQIFGGIKFTFNNLVSTTVVAAANIVVHMEFLNE